MLLSMPDDPARNALDAAIRSLMRDGVARSEGRAPTIHRAAASLAPANRNKEHHTGRIATMAMAVDDQPMPREVSTRGGTCGFLPLAEPDS